MALPGGVEWPPDHQPSATAQHEVRGAVQRLDILFDPEEGMPEHIAYPTAAKDHGSQQGEVVAWGECVLPRPSTRSPVAEGPDEGTGHRQKPGVEEGMPGGEKGRIDFPMGVRPAVDERPTY